MREEIIQLNNVIMEQNGDRLVDGVSLHICCGEILGLIAFQAKGKEELVRLMCQNIPIDAGQVYYKHRMVNNYEHSDLSYNGVYVIERKSSLVKDLTVADNVFVLRRGFKKYVIQRRVLRSQLLKLFAELEITIAPELVVERLKPLERCVVELVKAELQGCQLIILKDISNFLGPAELERFYQIIRNYRKRGMAFLYVGNHHEEVFRICDRAALMYMGRIVKVFDAKELTTKHIMPYTAEYCQIEEAMEPIQKSEEILAFHDVYSQYLQGISFVVHRGDCVVLLDINNASNQEIIRIMLQQKPITRGKIQYEGKAFEGIKTKQYLRNGIAVIQDSPLETMLFPEMSYLDNLLFLLDQKDGIHSIKKQYRKSILREYEPQVGPHIHDLNLREVPTPLLYDLIYYRMQILNPKLLFCIQPFAGNDMYARARILEQIQTLKERGIGIVIAAVNLSDSLRIANRVILMDNGEWIGDYDKSRFDELRTIMRYGDI